MKFRGRTALVTGASKGIGRATAVELASEGADVALNYHSGTDEAHQAAREIEALGRRALLLQADIADQSAVEEMVAKTVSEFGRIDLLVSNAVYSDRELLVKADMARFRRTIDVSMWGALFALRATAQQMIRQGEGGSIVVVSSPHANVPIPTAMAYNMSKAAIDQMARTAAIELVDHRIRVNIVHPGWIDTPGERKFFSEEQMQEGGEKLPWKRLGRPDEVAKCIAYILSDDADYMTGSTVKIDGGVGLPWWSRRGKGGL